MTLTLKGRVFNMFSTFHIFYRGILLKVCDTEEMQEVNISSQDVLVKVAISFVLVVTTGHFFKEFRNSYLVTELNVSVLVNHPNLFCHHNVAQFFCASAANAFFGGSKKHEGSRPALNCVCKYCRSSRHLIGNVSTVLFPLVV